MEPDLSISLLAYPSASSVSNTAAAEQPASRRVRQRASYFSDEDASDEEPDGHGEGA